MNITTTTGFFPLLQPDSTGKPFSSILGYDLVLSQALPNPIANSTPMLFGNFSEGYTVRQAGSLVVRRCTERYFEENATAFAAWGRVGSYNSVASTATPPIVKLVMAAS